MCGGGLLQVFRGIDLKLVLASHCGCFQHVTPMVFVYRISKMLFITRMLLCVPTCLHVVQSFVAVGRVVATR